MTSEGPHHPGQQPDEVAPGTGGSAPYGEHQTTPTHPAGTPDNGWAPPPRTESAGWTSDGSPDRPAAEWDARPAGQPVRATASVPGPSATPAAWGAAPTPAGPPSSWPGQNSGNAGEPAAATWPSGNAWDGSAPQAEAASQQADQWPPADPPVQEPQSAAPTWGPNDAGQGDQSWASAQAGQGDQSWASAQAGQDEWGAAPSAQPEQSWMSGQQPQADQWAADQPDQSWMSGSAGQGDQSWASAQAGQGDQSWAPAQAGQAEGSWASAPREQPPAPLYQPAPGPGITPAGAVPLPPQEQRVPGASLAGSAPGEFSSPVDFAPNSSYAAPQQRTPVEDNFSGAEGGAPEGQGSWAAFGAATAVPQQREPMESAPTDQGAGGNVSASASVPMANRVAPADQEIPSSRPQPRVYGRPAPPEAEEPEAQQGYADPSDQGGYEPASSWANTGRPAAPDFTQQGAPFGDLIGNNGPVNGVRPQSGPPGAYGNAAPVSGPPGVYGAPVSGPPSAFGGAAPVSGPPGVYGAPVSGPPGVYGAPVSGPPSAYGASEPVSGPPGAYDNFPPGVPAPAVHPVPPNPTSAPPAESAGFVPGAAFQPGGGFPPAPMSEPTTAFPPGSFTSGPGFEPGSAFQSDPRPTSSGGFGAGPQGYDAGPQGFPPAQGGFGAAPGGFGGGTQDFPPAQAGFDQAPGGFGAAPAPWGANTGDADQDRFNSFKPEGSAQEVKPEEPLTPKVRNGRVLAAVVVVAVLILAVPLGLLMLLGKIGGEDNKPSAPFDPAVGSCVMQDGNGAKGVPCTEAGAFTVVSKADSKDKCADPSQPSILLPGSGPNRVLCLKPAGQ